MPASPGAGRQRSGVAWQPAGRAPADYFAPTRIGDRVERGFAAVAAPREWFREQFEASGTHPWRTGFEIEAFLRRPALLQQDGRVAVLAPRGIEGWMSATGWYFRFLDLARDRSEPELKKFSRFNGQLIERYAVHLTHVAHPGQDRRKLLSGTGRVHREKVYRVRGGESKTSDAAIDLGMDLVLVEVNGKRVTKKSFVEADPVSVKRDLEQLFVEKVEQIARVIHDLATGVVSLDGIDMAYVRRVWPIVVTPDGLFQNPSLWAWADKQTAPFFDWPQEEVPQQVQPVTFVDQARGRQLSFCPNPRRRQLTLNPGPPRQSDSRGEVPLGEHPLRVLPRSVQRDW